MSVSYPILSHPISNHELGLDLHNTGIPTESKLHSLYSKFNPTISLSTISSWSGFYLTFLFFKNCVIIHGVKQRLNLGVASSANAQKVAGLLPLVVSMMEELWKERGLPTFHSHL